jgi:hypothetical protein
MSEANVMASFIIAMGVAVLASAAYGVGRTRNDKQLLEYKASLWGYLFGVSAFVLGMFVMFRFD